METTIHPMNDIPFRILLADNNEDDNVFFDHVLMRLQFNKHIQLIEDGEALITYLTQDNVQLPDVIFLDYNLPNKGGADYLIKIKQHAQLKEIPVIMYSGTLQEEVTDSLYDQGAYFFVHKTDNNSLEKILRKVFATLFKNKTTRPGRAAFIIAA